MSRLIFFLIPALLFGQIKNYVVNSPQNLRAEEVSITINPANPDILAAGANITFFFSSTDGGKTWAEKNMVSSLGVHGDPSVVFDNEGNLYYAHLSNPMNGYWIDRIVVQKSTDYGETWNDGVGVGYTYPRNQDKEWLAVDNTNSKYSGNVYMAWTEFDDYGSSAQGDSSRILFSCSVDSGITWMEPLRLSDTGGNAIDSDNTTEGAVPAVGPDGEVYVAWAGPLGIMFDRSFDGGLTFGEDIFISDNPGGWDFDIPGISRCNGMPVTCADVSGSPYSGNVYVMWGDLRNGENNADVFFSRSTDKGTTWSEPLKVNGDNTDRHQFFPWMTVDPATGHIYLVYYDRRNTEGVYTDVYAAMSSDGGQTFTEIKISESSFQPQGSIFIGDYTNIAALNGKIHPIWTRADGVYLSVLTVQLTDSLFTTSGVEDKPEIPEKFELFQNYPNPFNPATTISYKLPERAEVIISVYDVLGNLVNEPHARIKDAGVHEYEFNAAGLSSGIYICSVKAGKFSGKNKMILLK